MSVVVKGMNLPKCCMLCRFVINDYHDEVDLTDYGCRAKGWIRRDVSYNESCELGFNGMYDKRRDDCPLIEIKD